MFDPITLTVGAALVGVGWLGGRLGRRAPKTASLPAPCGCGHDLALHDRDSGACHAEIFRKNGHGMKEWVGCNCRRYTGPTPLEEFFTPSPLPPAQ
ncbi:hypothetical protein KO481_09790 [Nocardia sp. NEAU-G5]|uniref:Uncharacterized protein n=1 Tax=Nocardia albiluteola TaxID=2842303 RepID=A0ABS6AXU2_9NOCA|nr:hypothetical protein [Nocardia albiluteola]MBU3061814.1 hypothetical protein [Nocardia albiluteola]